MTDDDATTPPQRNDDAWLVSGVPGDETVRDGALAQLSELQAGDQVLVHVYPASSEGDRMVVERVFAGTLPTNPGLEHGDDDEDDGANDQPAANT